MKTIARIVILFITILLPMVTRAIDASTADVFEMKTRLEQMVSARIRTSLETRLHPDDFIVSANVRMVRDEKVAVPPPKPAPAAQNEDSQFLPSLPGYISANTVMSVFEKELSEAAQAAKAQAAHGVKSSELAYLKDLKDYRVISASVSVGLKQNLSADYQRQLKTWLDARMKAEFGRASSAEIGVVAPHPEKPKEEPPKQTFFEKMERLQWPIVVLIFGAIAFIGLIVYQWLKSRLRNVELQHKVNMKKMDMENKRELEEARKNILSNESQAERAKREKEEMLAKKNDLHRRILSSLKNFPDPLSAIGTLVTYEDGGKHVAALLDSVYSMDGKENVDPHLPDLFFKLDLPESQKKDIQKSFTSYQDLTTEEKIPVLENAFWRLAKIGVLADYQDKKPFQYLRRLSVNHISGALGRTQPAEKMIALLHLPEDYQRNFVASLSDETKVELLENTFKKETVSQQELNRVNEALYRSYKEIESEFQIAQGAMDLLRTIRASDEIKIITRLGQTNPSAYESIRKSYLSLAFLDQWNQHSVRVLVDGVEVSDLTCLVKTFPNLKAKILASLSERVGQILNDDLTMKDQINEVMIEAGLEKIRSKMRDLEKDGTLDLRTVYEKTVDGEGLKLAS